ncbi:MAG TPA: hypothetical protein VFG54_07245 [Prolixibacteraceae bacterium]|nr:hypothetical protein [Prolixibacteraceae bacterium]
MVWFSFKKLEDKISRDLLTESDGYKYFMATAIYIAVQDMYNSQIGFSASYLVHSIISLAFVIATVMVMYEINQSIDGKDFLKRFISVMWMVKLRVLPLYFISLWLFKFYFRYIGSPVHAYAAQYGVTILICTYSIIAALQSFKRIRQGRLQLAGSN